MQLSQQQGREAGAGSNAGAVLRHLAFCLGVLALSACTTRGGDIPYAPANFVAPTPVTTGELAQDLPLGPLDLIRVTVFRVPDLSGDYRIGADGELDMPLVGRINVRNQTPDQVATQLEKRYSEKYLNNPDITIRVVDSGQRNITVEGGVNSPGVFQLNGSTTLLTAIALAKGVNAQDANSRRVAIFRKVGGQATAAAFDLIDIRRGKMENPLVYPGDTIVVETNSTRSLFRDLLQVLPTLAVFATL